MGSVVCKTNPRLICLCSIVTSALATAYLSGCMRPVGDQSGKSELAEDSPVSPKWREKYGLAETGAPNTILLRWLDRSSTQHSESDFEITHEIVEFVVPEQDPSLITAESSAMKWLRIRSVDYEKKHELDLVCLENSPGLMGLLVENVKLTERGLQRISNLQQLRWLCIIESQLPASVDRIQLPQSLEVLSLAGSELPPNFANSVSLSRNLRTANFSVTNVTDSAIGVIANHCPEIKHLDFFHCKSITTNCMKDLLQIRTLRSLVLIATEFEDSIEGEMDIFDAKLPNCYVVILD